jgi:hypothetical protein
LIEAKIENILKEKTDQSFKLSFCTIEHTSNSKSTPNNFKLVWLLAHNRLKFDEPMNIQLLKREEIDDKRWNGCVHFAISAMPYAYTWYLDNVSEEWEGLVLGNYRAVMPLVFEKKWGFSYLYQPFFTQQLGIFSDMPIAQNLVDAFFEKIPKKYQYIDIQLNESNPAPEGFEAESRPNYLLELKESYENIRKGYSGNLLKNLARAEKNNLSYVNHLKPELFVDFYIENTAKKVSGFKEKHKHSMLRIIYQAQHYSMGGLAGVYRKNELVAANFLIFHPQRTINLMPAVSEEGKKMGAMAFLMDTVVKIGAGQRKFLDFEGSAIEGVAKFYESFGAKKTTYYRVKRNNLPAIIRFFKK